MGAAAQPNTASPIWNCTPPQEHCRAKANGCAHAIVTAFNASVLQYDHVPNNFTGNFGRETWRIVKTRPRRAWG